MGGGDRNCNSSKGNTRRVEVPKVGTEKVPRVFKGGRYLT